MVRTEDANNAIHPELGKGYSYLPEASHQVLVGFRSKNIAGCTISCLPIWVSCKETWRSASSDLGDPITGLLSFTDAWTFPCWRGCLRRYRHTPTRGWPTLTARRRMTPSLPGVEALPTQLNTDVPQNNAFVWAYKLLILLKQYTTK